MVTGEMLHRLDVSLEGLVASLIVLRGASWAEQLPGSSSKLEEPQDTRSRIYDYIRMHPGTHVREIGRQLGIGMGDLQYHLYGLERQQRIKTLRRGLYKFVFAVEIFGERQSVILSVLSQETPRELILHLIERPNSTQSDLAKLTSLSSPTISWHMKRLVGMGIIARERKGKVVTYNILEPIEDLGRFMQNYHPSVWEKWAGRLTDIILAISEETEQDEVKKEAE